MPTQLSFEKQYLFIGMWQGPKTELFSNKKRDYGLKKYPSFTSNLKAKTKKVPAWKF